MNTRRTGRRRRWRRWRQACAQRVDAESEAGGDTSARSEKRHRQNALLRRNAAVEEGAAIAALIFPELGRIDEERVTGREERVRSQAASRQLQQILISKGERVVRILGSEVLAEL